MVLLPDDADYDFPMDAALEVIHQFNDSIFYIAAERTVAASFEHIGPNSTMGDIAVAVVVLDGLWATQLYRDPGSHDRIIDSLTAHWECIWNSLNTLEEDTLAHNPALVYEVARRVFPYILNVVREDGRPLRRNYSFTSKFFHWCTRQHFPIVDSNARTAVNKFQRDRGFCQGQVRAGDPGELGPLGDYERWICFYSALIRSLSAEQRNQIVQTDFDSQHEHLRRENTLLRVLDKVFYGWRSPQPD